MEKLTKEETVALFIQTAKKYNVPYKTNDGKSHDYFSFYSGNIRKAVFRVTSRVNWMRVYFDKTEKPLFSQNGFTCTALPAGKTYDYIMHLDPSEFDTFFRIIKEYL